MIEFKGLTLSMIRNMTEEGGNGTLIRNQIGFPSSLFRDALKDKLSSGERSVVCDSRLKSKYKVLKPKTINKFNLYNCESSTSRPGIFCSVKFSKKFMLSLYQALQNVLSWEVSAFVG